MFNLYIFIYAFTCTHRAAGPWRLYSVLDRTKPEVRTKYWWAGKWTVQTGTPLTIHYYITTKVLELKIYNLISIQKEVLLYFCIVPFGSVNNILICRVFHWIEWHIYLLQQTILNCHDLLTSMFTELWIVSFTKDA